MKFKYLAGASIVPTLSRLVLALVFLTAGYSKLFVSVPYSAADVEALGTLGIDVTPPIDPDTVAARPHGGLVMLASYLQEEPAPEPETPSEEVPEPPAPADEPAADDPKEDPPATPEPAPAPEPAPEPEPAPAPETPALDDDESELLESLKASVREAADEARRKADAIAERKKAEADKKAVKPAPSPPPVELDKEEPEVVPDPAPTVPVPAPPTASPTAPAPDETEDPADTPAPVEASAEPTDGDAPSDGAPAGTAKGLHKITLMVHNDARLGTLPPGLVASSGQVAAWTEFIGGALLLIGFLSRVWGLGLAFAMGVAFYLTSFEAYWCEVTPFGLATDLGANIGLFNRMGSQLGLGVLAFGIFLTGPGPLSLDYFLFGRRGRKAQSVIVDED